MIVVLGLARSGVAAARMLADAGARVTVYDRRPAGEHVSPTADRAQAAAMTTEQMAAADPLLAFIIANDAAASAIGARWAAEINAPTARSPSCSCTANAKSRAVAPSSRLNTSPPGHSL